MWLKGEGKIPRKVGGYFTNRLVDISRIEMADEAAER
jgi:hypothetical protein